MEDSFVDGTLFDLILYPRRVDENLAAVKRPRIPVLRMRYPSFIGP